MATYLYHVNAESEEGEVFDVSEGTVEANSRKEAQDKAYDEGWDRRLTQTGCLARIRVRRQR